MIDPTILKRNARPVRYEAATHLFTTGQINPRTFTASLARSRREEIHNNIASGTTTNITNTWQRRIVLNQCAYPRRALAALLSKGLSALAK
jgi:hypothetical protein